MMVMERELEELMDAGRRKGAGEWLGGGERTMLAFAYHSDGARLFVCTTGLVSSRYLGWDSDFQ